MYEVRQRIIIPQPGAVLTSKHIPVLQVTLTGINPDPYAQMKAAEETKQTLAYRATVV